MQTGTRLTPISLILASGLFLLTGVLFDTRPALAQLDCPLPEGVAPLADPPVTAQQVEDGSADLRDFALAVRDIFVSESQGMTTPNITTLKQLAYVGCLFRQEGGSVAFRFHLCRETGAQRQGARSLEGHGIVRRATQPRNL